MEGYLLLTFAALGGPDGLPSELSCNACGVDKKWTNLPMVAGMLLQKQEFCQLAEGLQNLYAPVRFRPAPPVRSISQF